MKLWSVKPYGWITKQYSEWDFLVAQRVKSLTSMWETWIWSLGWDDPLEKGKSTHSSMSFPCGSDGKESACNAGDLGSIPRLGRSLGEGNGNPLQYSCLENPMDGGAWKTTVHGVSKSQTRLGDFHFHFDFPGGSDDKASVYNAGDPGLIPGWGRSPGKENGNPLQYSCLENLMDGGAWWAAVHGITKSQTWLSN